MTTTTAQNGENDVDSEFKDRLEACLLVWKAYQACDTPEYWKTALPVAHFLSNADWHLMPELHETPLSMLKRSSLMERLTGLGEKW